jgi:hypothetical protein
MGRGPGDGALYDDTHSTICEISMGYQETIRQEIMDCLDVYNVTLSERYLGMPSYVGTSISGAFKYLKDRAWKMV